MPLSADSLFEQCRKDGPGAASVRPEVRIQVTGTVKEVLLGHDNRARIVLNADLLGRRTVVCRCAPREALRAVAAGRTVTVEGRCPSLEDPFTVVLEACALVLPATETDH